MGRCSRSKRARSWRAHDSQTGSRFPLGSATYSLPFHVAGILITRLGFACAGAGQAAQMKTNSATPIKQVFSRPMHALLARPPATWVVGRGVVVLFASRWRVRDG